jgi:RHS repeat-associated protein
MPHAHYEYGPFAEPIRITGPAAAVNPFRFATKCTDPTTELVLYEYRAYNLTLGRWTHRDPVASDEFGLTHEDVVQKMADEAIEGMGRDSHNAYLFVRNSPTDAVDLLGLVEVETGVNRAETPLRYIAIEAHYFLEVEGTTCGFWPKGGKKKLLSLLPFMWVKGYVYSPDRMMEEQPRRDPVKLDPCRYEIGRFVSCIQSECYSLDAGLYNLVFRNCWHWREALIRRCMHASKR